MEKNKIKYIKDIVEDQEVHYDCEELAERIKKEEWMQNDSYDDIIKIVKTVYMTR